MSMRYWRLGSGSDEQSESDYVRARDCIVVHTEVFVQAYRETEVGAFWSAWVVERR